MQANQHDLRVMVRGAYDLQKLRIQMGNRIVGNFKAKLGQAPGESEDESLDAEGKKILNDLRAHYRKITYDREASALCVGQVLEVWHDGKLVSRCQATEKDLVASDE